MKIILLSENYKGFIQREPQINPAGPVEKQKKPWYTVHIVLWGPCAGVCVFCGTAIIRSWQPRSESQERMRQRWMQSFIFAEQKKKI